MEKKHGYNLKQSPSWDWVARFIGRSSSWYKHYKTGLMKGTKETNELIEMAYYHYELVRGYVGRMMLTRSKEELMDLFKTFLKER
jgi:ABC-type Fe3+/spermidine/putrescine transport system ATPase subunit